MAFGASAESRILQSLPREATLFYPQAPPGPGHGNRYRELQHTGRHGRAEARLEHGSKYLDPLINLIRLGGYK